MIESRSQRLPVVNFAAAESMLCILVLLFMDLRNGHSKVSQKQVFFLVCLFVIVLFFVVFW